MSSHYQQNASSEKDLITIWRRRCDLIYDTPQLRKSHLLFLTAGNPVIPTMVLGSRAPPLVHKTRYPQNSKYGRLRAACKTPEVSKITDLPQK